MAAYKNALLSANLQNDEGDTHSLTVTGSVFEIMHVCGALGLEPDPELGEGGVMFVNGRHGSWGSVRPVDRAQDILDLYMESRMGDHDCGNHD